MAPIDKCYELVGLIRSNWRGLRADKRFGKRFGRFFDELRKGLAILMPDLNFSVDGAEAVPFAATPMIALKLHIENAIRERRFTPSRCERRSRSRPRGGVTRSEKEQLLDLFGEPDRWSHTLRSMLWTHASTVVPSFPRARAADLQVPCTFDFNVAATKYFHGVSDGDIPLNPIVQRQCFLCRRARAPCRWLRFPGIRRRASGCPLKFGAK